MVFLKLTNHLGVKFIVNMAHVTEFRSDGTGHTDLVFMDDEVTYAHESFEVVERMLQVALIGNKGVVAVEDAFAGVK